MPIEARQFSPLAGAASPAGTGATRRGDADPRSLFPRVQGLGRLLPPRGWLTVYQINHLFLDRGGELRQANFLLLERLGEGGMGQVFKAKHLRFDCLVALKLVRPNRSASEEFVRRFRREMAAAVKLDHPNIVRTVDVREIEGVLYFAMEYLDGIDLYKYIKPAATLSPAEACGRPAGRPWLAAGSLNMASLPTSGRATYS